MKIEVDKTKKEEGLPEVALNNVRKNPAIFILIGLVIVIVGSMYFYARSTKEEIKPVEETYNVQPEPQIENKLTPTTGVQASVPKEAPPPKVNPEVIQQQMVIMEEKKKELQQRLSAPLMLVNASQANATASNTQQAQTVSMDANTQFMNQVSAQNTEAAMATIIGPLNYVIAEGSFIHAILESATNSDLPGYLRAIVSEPVYSADGSQILVPPASLLLGQYKSGMLQGQSRIFVVWRRLITPEGISVQLGSAGVDSLGVAGIGADEVNRHFWEKFGNASLLSLLGAGAANVGVNGQDRDNSAASYRAAVASSFAQSADQSLQQDSVIATTLKTHQGKPIIVFVARDLNFQGAMKQTKPKLNVF